jgi:hypothetical protein
MKTLITQFILLFSFVVITSCEFSEMGRVDDLVSGYDSSEIDFELAKEGSLDFNIQEDRGSSGITKEQKDDLVFMFQEEKVARDVYLKFAAKYGTRIFSNIASSEQRHMDAIRNKINKYNVSIAGYSDGIGKFMDNEFTKLYKSLVKEGNASLKKALNVGIQIEVLDIADLEERIPGALPDIKRVYQNLLKGSENHLSAFQSMAAKY